MKKINPSLIKQLSTYEFWLLTLAGGLIAVNLSLKMRLTGDLIWLSVSLLFWSVILSRVWEKRSKIILESGGFSTCLGFVLIAFVLVRSLFTSRESLLFEFSPVISAVGLILLASGFKGFKVNGQELVLILALSIPQSLLSQLIDPSTLTANFATYMLSHCGVKTSSQGVYLVLNNGSVEVLQQCAGLVNMLLLWQLAVLFIVVFPTNLAKKIIIPVIAVAVGFIVNAVRIAILTILVTNSQKSAFEYWHDGDGAQLFVVISMMIFGSFCYFMVEKDRLYDEKPMEYSE